MRAWVAFWVLGMSLQGVAPSTWAADAVEVLLSPDRQGVEVDRRMLLAIYAGRVSSWPDGRPIRVFTFPDDHPLHAQFCRQLLSTYPYVLRNAWDKLVYTGTGFAPTMVTSEAEMRRRIQNTAGAIGYASEASRPDAAEPQSKTGESSRALARGLLVLQQGVQP